MPAADRTCVSFANFSQVGEAGLEVAPGLDAAQVPVVAVRADHVLAFAQRLVGDHLDLRAYRAERAAVGAECLPDLGVLGRAEVLAQHRE